MGKRGRPRDGINEARNNTTESVRKALAGPARCKRFEKTEEKKDA